jgi:hypothetical protein
LAIGARLRKRVILTEREFLSAVSVNRYRPGRCLNIPETLNLDPEAEGALDYGTIRGSEAAIGTGASRLLARA